jgi:hypothetical protein
MPDCSATWTNETERPGRVSITYRLPGLACEYTGTRRPYGEWVLATWKGGLAVWRIWFRTAGRMAWGGEMPWPPRLVGKRSAVWMKEIFDHLLAEGRKP